MRANDLCNIKTPPEGSSRYDETRLINLLNFLLVVLMTGLFMWRRESGGTGSVPVGEVGTTVVAQNLRPEAVSVSVNSTQWIRHPSQHHSHPRRCDSSELADSTFQTEAIKLVRELNKAVASHVSLAAHLGGSGDGPHLRDELRKARRTAQEAAAAAKATLLPSLLDQRWSEKERTELERLWHLLLCCLDALETSMQRCLILLREFSLTDGNNILIQTGLEFGPNHQARHQDKSSSSSSAAEPVDVPLVDKLALEGVEASQLCKELFELRAQLQELKSTVEIRSLSAPDFEDLSPTKNPRRNDTLLSINGTDGLTNTGGGGSSISCSLPSDEKESIESEGSQADGITNAQRKCICWILGCMVFIFFLAMILGVFIALFS